MSTSGERPFGDGFGGQGSGGQDFERLARQYWNAWGEAMRAGATPPQAAVPGWNDAMAWWSSQLAPGAAAAAAPRAGDDAIGRFNAQAQHWFAQMQQLATRFAGQPATPADIAAAWQRMLGADSANVLADLFKHMHGAGPQGMEQWMAHMAPVLRTMQGDARSWLGLPAFGFAREHQERWQSLAQAQLDYQEKYNAYNALVVEATQQAFRRFEEKLAERSGSGKAIESARALFDLWIDAAEDAYADIAMSPRFGEAYGDMVNAQMRVRAGLQREVEQYCAQLGIPTRSEIDAAHRKIVQLERELRRMRDAMARGEGTSRDGRQRALDEAGSGARPGTATSRTTSSKASAKKSGKSTKEPRP